MSFAVPPARNVLAISVSPAPASIVNLAFGSVTLCTPGSSNCQAVDGIMIDTGSTGLRLRSSALSPALALHPQNDSLGNPVAECAHFADGFSWGPVKLADVTIAGEHINSLPIQVIGDAAFALTPTTCSSVGTPRNLLDSLGANGILGVSIFRQDCGVACTRSTSNVYFACASTGCQPVSMPLGGQVQNPVALFAGDNNGVIVQLPAVPPGGSTGANGALIFGIGTQANNGLGNAAVFALNPSGQFTTFYKGRPLTQSFIDSGSNALYFQDLSIPPCTSGFYCPPSTQALSAIIQGVNGTNAAVDFNVANADSLFGTGSRLTAFNNLASPMSAVATFNWGLPFFLGRTVFIALEGATVPDSATGPFVAF